MVNPIRYLTGAFDPVKLKNVPADAEIGAVAADFEPFEATKTYDVATYQKPDTSYAYPLVKPKSISSKIEPIDPKLRALIETLWKRAEPAKDAARGNIAIGLRGAKVSPTAGQTYSPHVAPLHKEPNKPAPAAFADDYSHIDKLQRTNAVTFRGDSRGPAWVIGRDHGFHPPNSRTDAFYLYGTVREYFTAYMKRRYNRDITEADYRSALNHSMPRAEDKALLVDYLMWRKVSEGEAFHLGRMVADEALKGYISTSRSAAVAQNFGTRYNKVDGWIYITIVRGGFVVPPDTQKWGAKEQEIAKWGSIPAYDIVGFRRIQPYGATMGTGPIYVRSSFRHQEPKAFEAMFNMVSGWKPPSG